MFNNLPYSAIGYLYSKEYGISGTAVLIQERYKITAAHLLFK